MKPRLLDLFCGAGGAAYGYMLAGFHATGIDCKPQPHYRGDVFIQGDALEYIQAHGTEFDVIHASPPCQAYSALKHLARATHPALVDITRQRLYQTGKPYIMENVIGAPMHFPLMLCGTMFGLETPCGAQLRRHRLFEMSHLCLAPGDCLHEATRYAQRRTTICIIGDHSHSPARRKAKQRVITVTGATPQQNVVRNTVRETFSIKDAQISMGIDWMGMKELSQAIPPAYTEWIGRQLIARLFTGAFFQGAV